jgi:hypothetical protein
MRRVGRLHAITDETHQSASLTASWLVFTKNPSSGCRLFRSIVSIRLAVNGFRRRTSKHRGVPTWFRSNFRAVYEHSLQEYPAMSKNVTQRYLDHNLFQEDFKNPDDYLFFRSACKRFGLWYRSGSGVSHPLHMERFGVPGKTFAGHRGGRPGDGDGGGTLLRQIVKRGNVILPATWRRR